MITKKIMKPILLLLAALVLTATLCGQGTVAFLNTGGTVFTTNNSQGGTGLMRGVNAYRIGLYVAPAGTTTPSLFTLVGVATNSSLSAGRFQYGTGNFDILGNTGQAIAYQVRAWSLASGASYEEAVMAGNAYSGLSAIGTITPTASSTAPPPALFGAGPANPPDFPGQLNSGVVLVPLLTPFPEPGTFALAILGAIIGGIFFRRRA